ncbi:MAG: T9SS type A sorting domain-containing protein [Paludibacter sp.]|nr:T9SS type A sorting domain-containing protein [Paludibacter sp.]
MKKITLLLALSLMCSFSAFATRYLVQSGASGAATWRAAGEGETLVDLTVAGKTLNAWLTATTFTNADEIWVIKGTYVFSAVYAFPTAGLDVYGGFIGTETTLTERSKGTDPWTFTNETILEGNNNTVQIFTPGGARVNTIIDGLTINKAGVAGGAAIVGRDGMTFQYCKFTNNISTGNGGALLLNGGGNVNSCYFGNNKGNSGGALHCGTAAGLTSGITNCIFENNQAAGGANNLGGALRSQAAGTLNIDNCIFRNNDAVANGSAIHIQLAAATNFTTLSNCLIYGNTTKAAVYMLGGTMNNCTVANNPEGGVYVASATIPSKIYNSVFWGPDTKSGGISSPASNSVAVIQNTAYTSIQSANFTGTSNTNNILLDFENTGSTEGSFYAGFADPLNNNYSLTYQSALLNNGQTIASVTTDLTGLARPQGAAYDIGAYELAYYNLTVTFNEGGTVNELTSGVVLSEPKGKAIAFTITPASGKSVKSVLYNNAEVKTELVEGVYTTPALTANSTLAVEFEDNLSTGINTEKQSFLCFSNGNQIEVQGLNAGEKVELYNVTGARMAVSNAENSKVSFNTGKGIYIVKVSDKVQKVVVR